MMSESRVMRRSWAGVIVRQSTRELAPRGFRDDDEMWRGDLMPEGVALGELAGAALDDEGPKFRGILLGAEALGLERQGFDLRQREGAHVLHLPAPCRALGGPVCGGACGAAA